jgi:PAS domain S-box-containing protein
VALDITPAPGIPPRGAESRSPAVPEPAPRLGEDALRLAIEASGAGVWTWDAATGQASWDDRFHALYGLPPGGPRTFELWIERLHDDDRARVLAGVDRVRRDGGDDEWNMTFRAVRPDGSVAWMHGLGRAARDEHGRLTRIAGINLDVTERLKAEEAVQRQHDEERDRTLQLLLQTAAQGILMVDAHGTIVTANAALETMFGWAPGALVGRSVEELMSEDLRDRHARHRAEYFAAPRSRPMGILQHLVGRRRDGTACPVEVSLNHVATQQGGVAIAFVTDITEREKATARLERAQASLAQRTVELEKRTAQLSRLAAELTLAEQRAREQLAKTLHDGLQQLLFSARLTIDRVTKLVADRCDREKALLDNAVGQLDEAIVASRSLAVELFPRTLHDGGLPPALVWLADWMRQRYRVSVDVSADPRASPSARDVRTLVYESVRELLFNAVKHAGIDRVSVRLWLDEDGALRVEVSDEGVGFDPAAWSARADSHHVGLGLFGIRERLALLGGRLDIDSERGKGARFLVIVPLAGREAAHREPQGPPETVMMARPLGILVVDDHAAVREGLREMLRDQPGLEVVGEAANGREAIEKAHALRPDVVIIDVSMPEMDGVEATRRIKAELPSIEVFGMSTHEATGELHAIERVGAAGYFPKGTNTERLVERLLQIRDVRRRQATL